VLGEEVMSSEDDVSKGSAGAGRADAGHWPHVLLLSSASHVSVSSESERPHLSFLDPIGAHSL
jgi:hypothetical protein